MSYQILSTKILNESQKKEIDFPGCDFIEKNFIEIGKLKFSYNKKNKIILFTSQNAVKIIFSKNEIKKHLQGERCYCVGAETKKLIEKNNIKVLSFFNSGSEMADYLVKKMSNEEFVFFCGSERLKIIETKMFKNNLKLEIIEVYKTNLIPQKIDKIFNSILFFSPSAVKSFLNFNSIGKAKCYCIGPTTASALNKHTNNIEISKSPTINILLQNVKKNLMESHDKK
ncbi:MAG: uroporphyrinogen-III synthase [Flavobacteriaceae bacterium]|nr:uroporphyrinogen-III synthase [Flavobacteriaceae bacterium]